MAKKIFTLILILCVSSIIRGQSCFGIPDSNASLGKVNIIPFGGKGPTGPFQNVKYQMLIPASSLKMGPGILTSIAFAPPEKAKYHFRELKVRIGHLKGTKLSSVYDSNIDKPVTVLDKSNWYWELKKGNSWGILPIEGKFLWDGRRDIVIEIITQGSSCSSNNPGFRRSSTLFCVYTLGYDPSKPPKSGYGPIKTGLKIKVCIGSSSGGALKITGKGCKSSNGNVPLIYAPSSPEVGKSFTIHLFRSPKSIPVILFVGNSTKKFGSILLPLDLKGVGAAGCFLYTNIIFYYTSTAGLSGVSTLNLNIPNINELKKMQIYMQWILLDQKANQAGISLTALGSCIIK